jgi:hypothetical protein
MIVPSPAAGVTDVIGRIIVERMREPPGQRIIIENVGGADGSIGVGRAARGPPDGYTICLGIMDTHVLNGAFYSLPYDVLHDFVPIAALGSTSIVLHGLFGGKDMTLFHLKRLDSSDGSETLDDIKHDRLTSQQRRYLNEYVHEYSNEYVFVGRYVYE